MSTSGGQGLASTDLPAGFQAADRASAQHQKVAARLLSAQLAALSLAALGGVVDVRVLHDKANLGGLLALVGFAAAVVTTLIAQARDAEGRWYRTRAAAESYKTLAWRYAVGGEPFGFGSQEPEMILQARFRDILAGLDAKDLTPAAPGPQVSQRMSALRSVPLDSRRDAYVESRIEDQEGWYFEKALAAARSARTWTIAAWAAGATGAVLGVLRLLTVIDADVLGLIATGVAGVAAWTQFRQHRVLAASYSVAQQELATVKITAMGITTESEWEVFVRDAEDAISREHTLWLARRGATPPSP